VKDPIKTLLTLCILFFLFVAAAIVSGCSESRYREPARLLAEANRPVYFEQGGVDRLGVLEYASDGQCFRVRFDCREVIVRGDGYHNWTRRECEVPFGYATMHAYLFAGFVRETTHFAPPDTHGRGVYTVRVDKHLTSSEYGNAPLCTRSASGVIE
jgi:hypothetical protein